MSVSSQAKSRGFTIVELLIVIVVIAILAAISIVAYNGIQSRARDAQRTQDMASIMKAMELYYIDNGKYPPSGGQDSPNSSADVPAGYGSSTAYGYSYATNNSWLKTLRDGKYLASAPIDPVNNDSQYYSYYVYNNGIGAECPEPVYALRAMSYDSASNIPSSATADLRNTCPSSSAAFRTNGARVLFSNIKN